MLCRSALFFLILTGFLCAPTQAGNKKAKPLAKWSGSVMDLKLQSLAPKNGVITNEKKRKEIWDAWKVKDKKKVDIDFDKQLILVATTRGSLLKIQYNVSKEGNLKVFAIASRDLRPGFRYQMILIPRKGIKTVKGKPLP